MKHVFSKFRRCSKGASAIEYALIASLIAVVVMVGAKALGSTTNNKFVNVSNVVKNR